MYTEQVFNEPLRGQAKETQEQSNSQKIVLQDARNNVITKTAMGYLELGKVQHSLELLRKERESAEKILQVTQERQGEGFELPMEVTKAQLTKAQVGQRILQLEGREDSWKFLAISARAGGFAGDPGDAEELPEKPNRRRQPCGDGVDEQHRLALAQSDVRAKEFRLKGEKRGHLPTLELVSVYSVLARYNNYDQFFHAFQAQ